MMTSSHQPTLAGMNYRARVAGLLLPSFPWRTHRSVWGKGAEELPAPDRQTLTK
jgi:hypothetical protein